MMLRIRNFRDDDAAQAAQIFFDSVQQGTQNYYSKEERTAWAPTIPDAVIWQNRLQKQITYVAEIDTKVVGFIAFQDDGYIDLLFVGPQYLGKGVGRALYNQVETNAAEMGIGQLTTQASLAAKEFFEVLGWQVKKRQKIMRGPVTLTNFVMSKPLER